MRITALVHGREQSREIGVTVKSRQGPQYEEVYMPQRFPQNSRVLSLNELSDKIRFLKAIEIGHLLFC